MENISKLRNGEISASATKGLNKMISFEDSNYSFAEGDSQTLGYNPIEVKEWIGEIFASDKRFTSEVDKADFISEYYKKAIEYLEKHKIAVSKENISANKDNINYYVPDCSDCKQKIQTFIPKTSQEKTMETTTTTTNPTTTNPTSPSCTCKKGKTWVKVVVAIVIILLCLVLGFWGGWYFKD